MKGKNDEEELKKGDDVPQDELEDAPEEDVPTEDEEAPAEDKKPLKASDIGIFVFLGVIVSMVIGAIVFVIYICSGSANGCNCGQCSAVGALKDFIETNLH